LPCTYAIWHFAERGDVWTFLGFPTYGRGPSEDIGIETAVPCSPIRPRPAPASTGWPGDAATKTCQPGTTSALASPETNEFSRSDSEWLLPY